MDNSNDACVISISPMTEAAALAAANRSAKLGWQV
jgi:hypothetical protein